MLNRGSSWSLQFFHIDFDEIREYNTIINMLIMKINENVNYVDPHKWRRKQRQIEKQIFSLNQVLFFEFATLK